MPYFVQASTCQFYQMPQSVQLLNFQFQGDPNFYKCCTSYRLQGVSFSKFPTSYTFDTPNFDNALLPICLIFQILINFPLCIGLKLQVLINTLVRIGLLFRVWTNVFVCLGVSHQIFANALLRKVLDLQVLRNTVLRSVLILPIFQISYFAQVSSSRL